MAYTLKTAKQLCEDMNVAAFVSSGWRHAMEGHYNFQNPAAQPDVNKSYFTFADSSKSGNVIGTKIMQAIQTISGRELRGDARNDSVVLCYRNFNATIGKDRNGRDLTIMRVVLMRGTRGPQTGKPIVMSCYPVPTITGTILASR